MIVEREDKISNFVKEPFYTVEIGNGEFTAEREKIKDKQIVDDIAASCNGKTAIITDVKRQEKSESPPKLYDLYQKC
jgi:DNA topoisomerase-3